MESAGAVESVRFYALSADPSVSAIVLVDLLHDPATGALEWSLRPVPASDGAARHCLANTGTADVPALMTLLRRYLAGAATR